MADESWNTHAQADGWKESSTSVFLPSGGVLEIAAEGLTGCEVRFAYDDDVTEAYHLGADVAMTTRPVRAGDHRVAVQWRGPVARPTRCLTSFHYLTRTLAELEGDAPDVAAVMKKNRPEGFVLCDAFILSQPQGAPYQVYGIFTVDKKALASGRPNAPVVKQDFLVHDRTSNPPEITYYTGFPAPGPHRSIEEFCERVGAPNYGCELVGKRWRCRDHHYSLEEFDRLPGEPGFQEAIEASLQQARKEIARPA